MEPKIYIGLVLSMLLAIGSVVFNESIKELIKKFFSQLSKFQINLLYFTLLILTIALPLSISYFVPSTHENDNIINIDSLNTHDTQGKDDITKYVEAGIKVTEETKKLFAIKHHNDSIKKANREKIWVYQIGLPKNDISELWNSYNSLQHFSNIFIFKESKNSFFIIKDDGYSEQELKDSLPNFKIKIDSIEKRIKIIDLMSVCPKRKKITTTKKIKLKKGNPEVPCYICN